MATQSEHQRRSRREGIGLLPKFVLLVATLIALLSISLSVFFQRTVSARGARDLEAKGAYLVKSLARAAQYGVFTRFPEILNPLADGAFAAKDLLFVQLLDSQGKALVTRTGSGFKTDSLTPLTQEQIRRLPRSEPFVRRHEEGGVDYYEFASPVMLEKGVLPEPLRSKTRRSYELIGAVRIGVSQSSLRDDLRRATLRVIGITFSIAAVSFLATFLLLKRTLAPIVDLADGTRRLSEGDFGHRLTVSSRDEIGSLARSFNEMARELDELHQQLERKVEERTEALAAKSRDMEEFVYTVSHDLKAPVVSTHGLISLLAEEFSEDLPGEARLYVDRIKANAFHMERLLSELAELSRVDRPTKAKGVVDVNSLVKDVLLERDSQIREAHATIEVAPHLPPALAYANHLTQVFDNLIGNAVKFRMPDRPCRVSIRGEVRDGLSVYEVEDNGIGIDLRYQEKVFGLFQRLHTEREYPGTGLGLAIVKKIVEKLGGRISLRSTPNSGSCFTFSVPSPASAEAGKV